MIWNLSTKTVFSSGTKNCCLFAKCMLIMSTEAKFSSIKEKCPLCFKCINNSNETNFDSSNWRSKKKTCSKLFGSFERKHVVLQLHQKRGTILQESLSLASKNHYLIFVIYLKNDIKWDYRINILLFNAIMNAYRSSLTIFFKGA